MIEVEIDKDSGFCFGVVTAIESAERELGNTDTLYCLGDIVHNSLEVERLEHMGLHTIDHDGLSKLRRYGDCYRENRRPRSSGLYPCDQSVFPNHEVLGWIQGGSGGDQAADGGRGGV